MIIEEHIHRKKERERDQLLKMLNFRFREPQNVQIHQNFHFGNLVSKQCFTLAKESNKIMKF